MLELQPISCTTKYNLLASVSVLGAGPSVSAAGVKMGDAQEQLPHLGVCLAWHPLALSGKVRGVQLRLPGTSHCRTCNTRSFQESGGTMKPCHTSQAHHSPGTSHTD
jgi:hypothetical protein